MNILEEAIFFATMAHGGQMRKLAKTPYILHPIEVAAIIATMTDDLEVMAAGVLHDTIEDTPVTPEQIEKKFGMKVFGLVQSETEDKLSNRPAADTWMERKEDSLLALKHTKNMNVKILWLADKLSNMRSFYREFLKSGYDIFKGLNQKDPKMQAWYYRTIRDYLSDLSDTAAYKEYSMLVDNMFKGV